MLAWLLVALPALASPLEGRPFRVPLPCPRYDLLAAARDSRDPKCFARALRHMDVNELDREGNTPLHVAIRARNAVAIRFLVGHGADLALRNFALRTPREEAEALGHRGVAEWLSQLEWETDRLRNAIDNRDVAAAKASIARGVALGTRDVRRDSLLHRAAQEGSLELTRLLLAHGAAPNARNYLGETPLHAAALRDFVDVMEALLAAGADPQAVNERRETVRDLAEGRNDPKVRALLKRYHAVRGSRADAPLDLEEVSGAGSSSPDPQVER